MMETRDWVPAIRSGGTAAAFGIILLVIQGCTGTMEVEPPGPEGRLSATVSRVVLTNGEVVSLEEGAYDLGPINLEIWENGVAAESVRTIPRTEIERFERPGGIDVGRTLFAVIVLPMFAVLGYATLYSLGG